MLSFRYPVSLSGANVFKRNMGGAVSLMQSRVDVNGTVHFIENSAVNGGGLALEDQCLVHFKLIMITCRHYVIVLFYRFTSLGTQRCTSMETRLKSRAEPYLYVLHQLL